MKQIFLIIALAGLSPKMFAQNIADTNFVTVITSVNWMPDGQSMIVNVVKFDKTRRTPPVSKGFNYDLRNKKLSQLDFEGGSKSVSPDSKTFVFTKQNANNKADIFLYDINLKQETPLVTDTFHKFAPGWSNDGKKIVYNQSSGRGSGSIVEVCVVNIATKLVKQITQSGKHKSYNPVWAPEGDKIVYYFEKGDGHDQIWLTDAYGSFHTNLSNDTSTHNYFPSWIDKSTIVYTQNPSTIMTMKIDGTNKQRVDGLSSFLIKYSPIARKAAYVTEQPDSKLILYDWDKKTLQVLLDQSQLKGLL